MDNEKTVMDIMEEVRSEVCDNLCKYTETTDDCGECDYVVEHGACPLSKLFEVRP